MTSYKYESRTFGIFFIFAFLSYGIGSGLIDSITSQPDFLSLVNAGKTPMVTGVVLMALVHSFFNIALPIIMLPILKPYNTYLAYGYLASAITATTVLTFGTIFLLLLLPLSDAFVKADASLIQHIEIIGTILKSGAYYAYHLGMAVWSIGGLMLVALLYKSQLIPRPITVLGSIGYIFLLSGSVMSFLYQSNAVEIISVIPGGIFEITLSIWLIIKGVNTSVIISKTVQK